MLIVMDKSTDEKKLSQQIQAQNEQFQIAITFLSGYNGILNVTNKSIIFYFTTSINVDDVIVTTLLPWAYELEPLNDEIN